MRANHISLLNQHFYVVVGAFTFRDELYVICSNITRVQFNSDCYIYMCTTCFGLYLGHSQACQHKNRTKEDKIKSKETYYFWNFRK